MSTTQTLFEPEGRPMRGPDETYAAWQARLDAWRRGFTGGNAEVERTLVTPAVGMPPVSARFAPSATGERLGDFDVTGTADLPAPQVASSASGMPATGTTSGTPAPSPSPQPWPSASFGGSVAPGLRAPPTMEEHLAWARRRSVLEATGFDPAWGTPPEVRGLRWSPMRSLYEPAPDETGAPYRRPADRGYYRQPRQSPVLGPGRWGSRWIEVKTNVPDPTRPYRILGAAEAAALDVEVNRASLARPLRAPEGGQIERQVDLREPAPGWIPPPTPAPAITRRPRMTDFAWIPQRDLPVGCPYPHAYLPVPRQDYVSGRWLLPDYVPSIPLPPPYDRVSWQCGVAAVTEPQKKGGKGGGNVSTDFMRNWRPPQLQEDPPTSSAIPHVEVDVGMPSPTGTAAPGGHDASEGAVDTSAVDSDVARAAAAVKQIQAQQRSVEERLVESRGAERVALEAELSRVKTEGRRAADRLDELSTPAPGEGEYAPSVRKGGAGLPPPDLPFAPEDAPSAPPAGGRSSGRSGQASKWQGELERLRELMKAWKHAFAALVAQRQLLSEHQNQLAEYQRARAKELDLWNSRGLVTGRPPGGWPSYGQEAQYQIELGHHEQRLADLDGRILVAEGELGATVEGVRAAELSAHTALNRLNEATPGDCGNGVPTDGASARMRGTKYERESGFGESKFRIGEPGLAILINPQTGFGEVLVAQRKPNGELATYKTMTTQVGRIGLLDYQCEGPAQVQTLTTSGNPSIVSEWLVFMPTVNRDWFALMTAGMWGSKTAIKHLDATPPVVRSKMRLQDRER